LPAVTKATVSKAAVTAAVPASDEHLSSSTSSSTSSNTSVVVAATAAAVTASKSVVTSSGVTPAQVYPLELQTIITACYTHKTNVALLYSSMLLTASECELVC
jgi:hypothetical protein